MPRSATVRGPSAVANVKSPVELVLEQTLDDGDGALGFHAEDRFAEAGSGGRSEQARPLEPGLGDRQMLERAIDDGREHLAGRVEIRRRHRAMAGALPRGEEPLEHVVDELTLAPRIHHLLILGLLLELQDVLREELERAVEIGLDRAHRPGARRHVAHRAVIIGRVRRRPGRPHFSPAARLALERAERDRFQRQRLVREHPRVLERLARQRSRAGRAESRRAASSARRSRPRRG